MATAPAPLAYATLEQAAHWYAQLRAPDASAADQAAWQAWLHANPLNAQAWAYVERVSEQFEPMRRDTTRDSAFRLLDQRERPGLGRRNLLRCLGTLLVVGAGATALGRSGYLPGALLAIGSDASSPMGEVSRVGLADGSELWLASQTAVDIRYQAGCTVLALRGGELCWQPGPNAERVRAEAGGSWVTSSGGAFTLRRLADGSQVSVLSGQVQASGSAQPSPLLLRSGQRAVAAAGAFGPAMPARVGAGAWRQGLVIANGDPLAEVLAELGRYTHAHLHYAAEVAGIRVVGSFPLGNVPRALSMLEHALPVQVTHPLPWWVNIQPA